MVPISKKVTFFRFVIAFFIYVDLFSGTLSLLGGGKDKTKVQEEIPVRHKRLEIPAEVNDDGKKQKEAFLALATYSLGFMNTDTQQAPFVEKFLSAYQFYRKGYAVSITNIERKYDEKDQWCRDLLQEPVLRDNKILYQKPYTWVWTEQKKKIVFFEYFSKDDEEHAVIQCPVYVRNHKVDVYFSTMGKSGFEDLKYYFVLTAFKPNDDSKLVILMRTKFHEKIDNVRDCYNENMYDFSQVGQIRLNIRPERFNDKYRLFGKYAEAAFILTNYGFWNPNLNPDLLYTFINTALTLSQGYEVQRRRIKSKAVVRDEGPHLCETHINTSRLFDTYKIKYDDSRASEIESIKQKITSFVEEIPDRAFRFLTCPVTQGSQSGFILHHPIYFKSNSKFSRYDLFWYVASDGEYEGKEVLLFLAPSQPQQSRREDDSTDVIVTF